MAGIGRGGKDGFGRRRRASGHEVTGERARGGAENGTRPPRPTSEEASRWVLDVAWGRGKTEIEGEESLGANFLAPTSLLKML